MKGDPDYDLLDRIARGETGGVCPICAGKGYYKKRVPVGHPDFGRFLRCTCQTQSLSQAAVEQSGLSGLRGKDFKSFNPRGRFAYVTAVQEESLKNALKQTVEFAVKLDGWLVLTGGFGCGKTHLAAAVANQALDSAVPVLFMTTADLLDWLRQGYQDQTDADFDARFNRIKKIKLLVLDDLGAQNTTPWAREKLFQILDYRYVNKLPTVITTNMHQGELDPRWQSRLLDSRLSTWVSISAPDYRAPMLPHRLSSLYQHVHQTFESFSVPETLAPKQKTALKTCLSEAKAYSMVGGSWLLITGPAGCGKTHLAAAIANAVKNTWPVSFIWVPDLISNLRSSVSGQENPDILIASLCSQPLLVLDELDVEAVTLWTKEKLLYLLKKRMNTLYPTVITLHGGLTTKDEDFAAILFGNRCQHLTIDAPQYK